MGVLGLGLYVIFITAYVPAEYKTLVTSFFNKIYIPNFSTVHIQKYLKFPLFPFEFVS
jgi:hypothetical protein